MTSPRVVVIGAGAAGLSAAWQAAKLGAASVVVLEANHSASGSSGLSAGIFNRQTVDPIDRQMRVYSVRVFDLLNAAGLLPLKRSGYLRLATKEEQVHRIEETLDSGESHAYSRFVTPGEIAELVPGIKHEDLVGGMYGPSDGSLDGSDLCGAYLSIGRDLGVDYHSRTAIIGLMRGTASLTVKTEHDSFVCDVVINAAGPWLGDVGDILGTPVGIDNQRHEIALIEVPSLRDRPIPTVQTYFPGLGKDAVYVRPEAHGKFITGLHSYDHIEKSANPDNYRRGSDPDYLERLAEVLSERFPGWSDASLAEGWTGLYPLSPDGRFIIGPHSADPRIISLGGLGGVGLTVSPAAGRIAAEWAVTGSCTTYGWAEELVPDRPELNRWATTS